MKTSKILLLASFAAAFASCTNEDLVTSSSNGNEGSVNGKLVDIGLLAMTKGTSSDVNTRAYSPVGNFVWMPEELETDGSVKNNSNQRIGLCWTGRDIQNPQYGATTTLTQNVYTNYEFEHVGWLDDAAELPATEACSANTVDNGAFIVGKGTPAASFSGPMSGGRYNKYYTSDIKGKGAKGAYAQTSHVESTGVLALDKGLFATCSQSVYEGEYLVYFPYTPAFTRGPIIASQPTSFNVNVDDDIYVNASKYAFCIGRTEHYKGGQQTAKLDAKTLSSFAIVDLSMSTTGIRSVKQVILYSKSKGLIYESALSAEASVNALTTGLDGKGNIANGSALLMADGQQKTNAIYANVGTNSQDYVNITSTNSKRIALPVLPQTVNDLQLIITNRLDQSIVVDLAAEYKTFESNTPTIISVDLANYTFTNNYVVVDEATLYSVLKKILSNGTTTGVNSIQMLNDITLNSEESMASAFDSRIVFDKNIRIWSGYEGTKLILNSENKLEIKSHKNDAVLNIDVDVLIKGRDCCGKNVAAMSVGGNQDHICNVNFNGTVTNEGTLALGNNAKNNSNIKIEKLVNQYDEYATTADKQKDAATLYLVGGQLSGKSNIEIGELQNSGIVQSVATSIALDNAAGYVVINTPYFQGDNRVVTTTIGTLANSGKFHIDNRVLVNVETSLANSSETSLIDIEGNGYSSRDGRLDVSAATATSAGTIDNRGVVNFTGGNLQNTGLFVDQTSGQLGGKYIDNGNAQATTTKTHAGTGVIYTTDLGKAGIYVAQVHTADRFNFVLTDAVVEPSTVIVEVLANAGSATEGYTLTSIDPNSRLQGKDVYVRTTNNCRFIAPTGDDEVASIGHCVTVFDNARLALPTGNYSVGNDLIINEGGETAVANNTTLTVNRHMVVDGTFTGSAPYDVKGTVTVNENGKFDSNATPNTIGAFVLNGGTATFAYQTTTTITGKFTSISGQFEREGLNGTSQYRATVNADEVDIQGGDTNTAWPTEKY